MFALPASVPAAKADGWAVSRSGKELFDLICLEFMERNKILSTCKAVFFFSLGIKLLQGVTNYLTTVA